MVSNWFVSQSLDVQPSWRILFGGGNSSEGGEGEVQPRSMGDESSDGEAFIIIENMTCEDLVKMRQEIADKSIEVSETDAKALKAASEQLFC